MTRTRRGLLWWTACVAATVLPAHGAAAPNDWAEGTDAADDGATRDFYNRGALLPWRNMGGDWVDRDGAAQGTTAWTSSRVDDTDTARFIEWDVTALVQSQVAGALPDHGFLLHAPAGGGPIDFSSREAAASAEHPQLVVDGTTLQPEADSYTEPSTYQSQGESDRMRVGSSNNALLRFDLSSLTGPIGSATLRVWTTQQFGGGADIGVFLPAPGRQGAPPDYEPGLAGAYDMDVGIDAHPDVVFFEDFESAAWMDNWTSHGGTFEIVDGGSDFGFDALESRALRSTIPEGENTGLSTTYDFMDETGSEPEEIYFRYYMRLGSTWNQSVDGGKLPGISGTYGIAGWGGRRSDGTNGWSARGLFRQTVPGANNPLGGYTPVGSYVYHADQATTYGDNFIWVDGWGEEGYGGVLHNERWYSLEYYVRLNAPGSSDGVIRAWVDGRLSFEKTDLRFRTVDTLRIERIWMNIYHGGTDLSPYDQHAFIDNVVVASSYIGPMNGAPTPPPPPPPPGDAGTTPGRDGGTPPSTDGGSGGFDSGTTPPPDSGGGCDCSVSRAPLPAWASWAFLTLIAARTIRRRRR